MDSIIREIELDIEQLEKDKADAIQREELAKALALQWAIAGLHKAIGILYRMERDED